MNGIKTSCALIASILIAGSAAAGEISTIYVGDSNGGISLDSAGDIYAANYGAINATTGSEPVWKISPTDAFTPFIFVSDINIASGNDFDSLGNLYQSNFGGDSITRVDPAGVATDFGGFVNGPVGIAIDDADNLYVSGCQENRIVRIEPDGTTNPFVVSSMLNCPNGITRADSGDFYVINWQDGRIFLVTPTGGISEFANIPSPGGHVTISTAEDRLYATSFGGNQIYGIALSGADAGNVVVTIGTGAAGSDDGGYFEASFNQPNGITADATGEVLYVTDATGVRRIALEDEAAPPPPPPPPAPPPPAGGGSGGGGAAGWGFLAGLLGMFLVRRRVAGC